MANTVTNPSYPGQGMAQGDTAMARRKGVITVRVVLLTSFVVVLGLMMTSRVFLTTQVTGLRDRMADLESRREYLEAGYADLQSRWNEASAPAVVIARAREELDLEVPESPGLVLVCLAPEADAGPWSRFWKSGMEEAMTGAMVSLQPRSAWAAGGGE